MLALLAFDSGIRDDLLLRRAPTSLVQINDRVRDLAIEAEITGAMNVDGCSPSYVSLHRSTSPPNPRLVRACVDILI